jgi:hypothetical protein
VSSSGIKEKPAKGPKEDTANTKSIKVYMVLRSCFHFAALVATDQL